MGKKQQSGWKTTQKFQLVHRSQHDPLIVDNDAPKFVLQQVASSNQARHMNKTGEPAASSNFTPSRTQEEIDKKVGQAPLYGIFYDDSEYDYTQHLRPMGVNNDAVTISAEPTKKPSSKPPSSIEFRDSTDTPNTASSDLPSELFASEKRMDVGMLNQQSGYEGLQPDMDPRVREVLEALDDEEFIDEELEEDFFDDLNATGERYDPQEEEEAEQEEIYDSDGEYNWQAAFKNFKRQQDRAESDDELSDIDDRRTMQTGFSVSSSVMHRTAHLRLLDDRFDVIEEEYLKEEDEDEDEVSSSDDLERDDFEAILDDFLDKYNLPGKKTLLGKDLVTGEDQLRELRSALIATHIHEDENEDTASTNVDNDPQIEMYQEPASMREAWDCESVLSTYTNLENHPRMISDRNKPKQKITINPKTGMPVLVETERKQRHMQTIDETPVEQEESKENLGKPRQKQESKEEKKARKQAIKETRKDRREQKKTTKQAFKDEDLRQRHVAMQRKKATGITSLP